MIFSHLHPLSHHHFSHQHSISPSQSSSLFCILSQYDYFFILYPFLPCHYPKTLSYSVNIMLLAPNITLSHHHLLYLSSSFSIIVSYHHFCPLYSVSPSLTNKLSSLWPLFSIIFSYYNPLVLPSLPMILTYCHRHPLSLLSSVNYFPWSSSITLKFLHNFLLSPSPSRIIIICYNHYHCYHGVHSYLL